MTNKIEGDARGARPAWSAGYQAPIAVVERRGTSSTPWWWTIIEGEEVLAEASQGSRSADEAWITSQVALKGILALRQAPPA